MGKETKTQSLKLSSEYFNELPPSVLKNIDDYKLFDNFVLHDTVIEIIRAVKFQVLG